MKVYWVPSPKYTTGHPAPLVAIVHHRMVGNLKGTDATFTTGARIASTNFGIGYGCDRSGHPAGAHIHQYVRLGDQAWGNGNWDPSGKWDDHYPTSYVNSRTISIEHHDNGHLSAGDPRKGVVPESVIVESVALDDLLLSGDLAAMKAAGIQFRGTGEAIARELRGIVPGPHTIVDHNYIAGRLKPYCWKPWQGDKVGFPQSRYLAALTELPDTGTEEPVGLAFRFLAAAPGTVKVKGPGHAIIRVADEVRVAVPDGQTRESFAKVELLEPLDSNAGDRKTGYLIGKTPAEPYNYQAAFILASDVTFTPRVYPFRLTVGRDEVLGTVDPD